MSSVRVVLSCVVLASGLGASFGCETSAGDEGCNEGPSRCWGGSTVQICGPDDGYVDYEDCEWPDYECVKVDGQAQCAESGWNEGIDTDWNG